MVGHRTLPSPGSPDRRHTLRLSVLSECNLRCAYCRPAPGSGKRDKAPAPLPRDVLVDQVRWLAGVIGLSMVRVTGGEPTLRRDLVALIAALSTIEPRPELTLTTNATQLARLAKPLREAGLDRVNISLDTIDSERFAELTRGGDVRQVIAGIEAAREQGLTPIKLNAVLRRSSWQQDVPELLDFARDGGYELRFLELMPTGTRAAWARRELVTAAPVRRFVAERADAFEDLPQIGTSPAQLSRVCWRGEELRVGWITPISHGFCQRCTRLRLDNQGLLRRCLMDRATFDLVAQRGQQSERDVLQQLDAYLGLKRAPLAMQSKNPMAQIGG